MDEVKAVMDLGDCYRIVFYMPHKSLRFIFARKYDWSSIIPMIPVPLIPSHL